jgi:AAA15 family ATPase/GTPase
MQAATDTIILTDSTTPEKPKFDIQNVYETTLAKLKVKVSAITIRSSTLHLIIKYVMELVEQTPLKGSEQKEMALKLIRALIIDFTDAEDERVLLQLLDDGTIGNMIDLIVDATRGRLDINTAVQVTTGCLNRCLPYLCL